MATLTELENLRGDAALEAKVTGGIMVVADEVSDEVNPVEFQPADVDTTGDDLEITDHGLADDTEVEMENTGGALPVPFAASTSYFVVNQVTNVSIQLALSKAGTPIVITSQGSGGHALVPVVANHANRALWAKAAFQDPVRTAKDIVPAVLGANNAATVEQIQSAPDDTILANVRNVVDIFATGV